MTDFARNFANGFEIAPDKTAIGIELFGKEVNGHHILDLTTSKTSVLNTIGSLSHLKASATCIGCGIKIALDNFQFHGRSFNGKPVQRLAIVLTDGANNVLTY